MKNNVKVPTVFHVADIEDITYSNIDSQIMLYFD